MRNTAGRTRAPATSAACPHAPRGQTRATDPALGAQERRDVRPHRAVRARARRARGAAATPPRAPGRCAQPPTRRPAPAPSVDRRLPRRCAARGVAGSACASAPAGSGRERSRVVGTAAADQPSAPARDRALAVIGRDPATWAGCRLFGCAGDQGQDEQAHETESSSPPQLPCITPCLEEATNPGTLAAGVARPPPPCRRGRGHLRDEGDHQRVRSDADDDQTPVRAGRVPPGVEIDGRSTRSRAARASTTRRRATRQARRFARPSSSARSTAASRACASASRSCGPSLRPRATTSSRRTATTSPTRSAASS